uniref:Uncharacterized protein n=1 Tax=Hyaloperonospora arabidopsidis (strain Emoy2) TaxID=559515 RepID=M4BJ38_HYAAE
MLHDNGLEEASGARTPIGEDSNNSQDESVKLSDKHHDAGRIYRTQCTECPEKPTLQR